MFVSTACVSYVRLMRFVSGSMWKSFPPSSSTHTAPFPVASGEVRLRGALVQIDETTGRALSISRVDEPGVQQTPSIVAATDVSKEQMQTG